MSLYQFSLGAVLHLKTSGALLLSGTLWYSFVNGLANLFLAHIDRKRRSWKEIRMLKSCAAVSVWCGVASLPIVFMVGLVNAEVLPVPVGEVILTVRGSISNSNNVGLAEFDRSMLGLLSAESFETTTIWTEGPQVFSGVSLAILLEHVGSEGENLRLRALNDYTIDIPASDAVVGGPIIAYEQNGAEMPVREKGPLWLVYPYDSSPEYQSETIYARSIWQLVAVEVLP